MRRAIHVCIATTRYPRRVSRCNRHRPATGQGDAPRAPAVPGDGDRGGADGQVEARQGPGIREGDPALPFNGLASPRTGLRCSRGSRGPWRCPGAQRRAPLRWGAVGCLWSRCIGRTSGSRTRASRCNAQLRTAHCRRGNTGTWGSNCVIAAHRRCIGARDRCAWNVSYLLRLARRLRGQWRIERDVERLVCRQIG